MSHLHLNCSKCGRELKEGDRCFGVDEGILTSSWASGRLCYAGKGVPVEFCEDCAKEILRPYIKTEEI